MPKKLSKKQKKKLEEQKKREDEAAENARIQEEEERKARELREAEQRKKDELYREEEKKRLGSEIKEIAPFRVALKNALDDQEAEWDKKLEWERYQEKGDNAVPFDAKEVADMFTRYQDLEIEDCKDYDEMLEHVQEVESLVHELKVFQLKSKVRRETKKELFYNSYIRKFREVTKQKIFKITAHISNNVNKYIEEIEKEAEEAESKGVVANNYNQGKKIKYICFSKEDIKYGMMISAEEKSSNTPYEYEEIKAKSYAPRNLPTGTFMLRHLWVSYDYLTEEDDMSNIMPVGGVIDVTTYNCLPRPKEFKSWKIQPYKDEENALDVYPVPKPDTEGKVVVDKLTNKILIAYRLPETLYIGANDERQAVLWVPETKSWTLDYPNDIELKNKVFEVGTPRLTPISFFQPRTVDFPYISWKLRSIEDEVAQLDLEGRRMTLKFHICSGYVILCPRGDPELAHLIGKKLQPAELLYGLYRCGINLLPEDRDIDHSLKVLKDPEAEDKAIEDICSAISSYYFQSTRWNAKSSDSNISPKDRVCYGSIHREHGLR